MLIFVIPVGPWVLLQVSLSSELDPLIWLGPVWIDRLVGDRAGVVLFFIEIAAIVVPPSLLVFPLELKVAHDNGALKSHTTRNDRWLIHEDPRNWAE